MENYIKRSTYEVGLGDSAELISQNIKENSVHAVVTDPPYGISALNLDWDKTLPPSKIWEECFRVLRPGGFLLAFGHTRLYHRLACQLEDVGLIIKECLCWAYASGFPRSYNIGAAMDKEGCAESDTWEGWGTQLKTSWEPIVMAQKPIEVSYLHNIKKWKVGALNIDECRIPYASEEDKKSLESFLHFTETDHGDAKYFSANEGNRKQVNVHPDGRWPANLLWLDPLFADYDRFFMIPKPSPKEKRMYNEHETVKPVRIMEQLIKLVTPKSSVIKENVVVLDPFMGSATTGRACRSLKRFFIGYEINPDSFEIAKKRLRESVRQDIGEI